MVDINEILLENAVYTVFDTETTGINPNTGDEIVEIAAMRVRGSEVCYDEYFDSLVNPQRIIPDNVIRIHGIKNEDVVDAPLAKDVIPKFIDFCGDTILVAQNAPFDMKFLNYYVEIFNLPKLKNIVINTIPMSKMINPDERRHGLDSIVTRLNLEGNDRHRALGDVKITAEALAHFIREFTKRDITKLSDIKKCLHKEKCKSGRTKVN